MASPMERFIQRLAATPEPQDAALMLFEQVLQSVTECVQDPVKLIKVLGDYNDNKRALLRAVFGAPSPVAEGPPNIMNPTVTASVNVTRSRSR